MLYLASSSPRRAELLTQIGVEFTILKVDIDETPQPGEPVADLVLRLSREKAQAARLHLHAMHSDDLILAADTLIHLQGQILGKPDSDSGCCAMLQRLSGRRHQVLTAIALINAAGETWQRCSHNEITFRPLSEPEIKRYCDSTEPLDKAGAYAIQGRAAIFIRRLEGSYSSVMGLPLFETAELLQQAGYELI
mgnify:CR=1 FL=1